MLPKILRFAMDSVLYYCVPMNRRAFTLRPSVTGIIINITITVTIHSSASAEKETPDMSIKKHLSRNDNNNALRTSIFFDACFFDAGRQASFFDF